jgi:leader peptidase (prepilin peptidase)/N-methyltransferase
MSSGAVSPLLTWGGVLFGAALGILALIDIRSFRLPDIITLPLMVAGLVVAFIVDVDSVPAHAIGAAIGFASFAAVRYLYRRLRGHDGLGLGDAKLMAAVGAWIGWSGLPAVVLVGSLAALLAVSIVAALDQELDLKRRVPFGAYLALGAWVVWLFGPLTIAM